MRVTRRGFLGTIAAALALGRSAWRPTPPPLGLSLRFVRDFSVSSEGPPQRFDYLYGYATLTPVHACRVEEG